MEQVYSSLRIIDVKKQAEEELLSYCLVLSVRQGLFTVIVEEVQKKENVQSYVLLENCKRRLVIYFVFLLDFLQRVCSTEAMFVLLCLYIPNKEYAPQISIKIQKLLLELEMRHQLGESLKQFGDFLLKISLSSVFQQQLVIIFLRLILQVRRFCFIQGQQE